MDFPLEKSNKPSTRKQIPDGIIFPLKHQRNNYKVVPPKWCLLVYNPINYRYIYHNNYSLQPKCPFLVEFNGFSYAFSSPEALSPLLLCHSRCHMTPRKPKLFLGSVHQQHSGPKTIGFSWTLIEFNGMEFGKLITRQSGTYGEYVYS